MVSRQTLSEFNHALLSGVFGGAAFAVVGGKVGALFGVLLAVLAAVGGRLGRSLRAQRPFVIAAGLTALLYLVLLILVPIQTYLETLLRGDTPAMGWSRVRALGHLFKSASDGPIGAAYGVIGMVLGEAYFRFRKTGEGSESLVGFYLLGVGSVFAVTLALGIGVQSGGLPSDANLLLLLHPGLLVLGAGPGAALTWGSLEAARRLARFLPVPEARAQEQSERPVKSLADDAGRASKEEAATRGRGDASEVDNWPSR